tara:strand:- start:350 stop:1168 length:819 start_codon:yes stop_codon:yes gene_type:complete
MNTGMKRLMESFRDFTKDAELLNCHRGEPAPEHVRQKKEREADRKAKVKRNNKRAIFPSREEFVDGGLAHGNVGLSNLYNGSIQEDDDGLIEPDEDEIEVDVSIDDEEDVDEAKKKEKKKQCTPGNARHSADGKFSSKANNTSYGLGHYKPNKGTCTSGKASMSPGSNVRRATKVKCGAKATGDRGGVGKERFKCKDGTPAWEVIQREGKDFLLVPVAELKEHLEKTQATISENNDKWKSQCHARGFYNLEFYLSLMNRAALAQDGKLHSEK